MRKATEAPKFHCNVLPTQPPSSQSLYLDCSGAVLGYVGAAVRISLNQILDHIRAQIVSIQAVVHISFGSLLRL